jgi:hypothetical protein
MRTKYLSKDGLRITADISTYKTYRQDEVIQVYCLNITPMYYAGRLERAYYTQALLHSINLTSVDKDYNYSELDLSWTDLPYKSNEEENSLNKMMLNFKPVEDHFAEIITKEIFEEDDMLEKTLDTLISNIEFKKMARPFEW